jgi:TctA family transporter
LLATIGLDGQSGVARYTFGTLELLDGLSIVALAMGLFGVAEIVTSVRRIKSSDIDPKSASLRASKPTKQDLKESAVPILRGAGIGAFFGALPGTGPSVAAFMTYAIEKRISRTPEKFGKGSMAGLTAPEAANNSADQTSFIPTLSLGIPGSPTMALMLGALMIHGISPGPNLISEQPSLFWGLVMSFWIGNLMLLVLNVPMIGLWVRLLMVPYRLMYPAILMFICIGAYSVRYSPFDVFTVLAFGVLGYLMRVLALPAAPLLLGFVLGPLIEMHFRRAMIMARGDYMFFLERPVTATVLALTVLVLIWSLWSGFKARKLERMAMASNE